MEKDETCLTRACPPKTFDVTNVNVIKLSEGSGGREMHRLISEIGENFYRGDWKNTGDDAASLNVDGKKLVFTTDSFVVTPLFFPGGNIGKIAFCGTVNDLAVMGAKPLGISLGVVVEEGFSKDEFFEIMKTIGDLSKEYNIPIVTGDTKVMERGSIDKIVINTSGVGFAEEVIDLPIVEGDRIIVSGSIGEHGAALLVKRFELESTLESDSKPLHEELASVRGLVKQARDITRGGLASVLNEIADKHKKSFLVYEEKIPVKDEVQAFTELLGIELYSLACEGRFLCVCSAENAFQVVAKLKEFNSSAQIIGEVTDGRGVICQTRFGKKILSTPSGNIVPRIC